MRQIRPEHLAEVGVPPLYRAVDMADLSSEMRQLLVEQGMATTTGIHLAGAPGVGKTYAAVCILKAWLAQGRGIVKDFGGSGAARRVRPRCYTSARFWSCPDLYGALAAGFRAKQQRGDKLVQEAKAVELAVFDDIWPAADWQWCLLREIITSRVNDLKPTVTTCHKDLAAIGEHSEALASRLGGYLVFTLHGPDLRYVQRHQPRLKLRQPDDAG